MDAHARYSVKSAHGKFGLHCVKAACLILRDPLFSRKRRLRAQRCARKEQRESAEVIVPALLRGRTESKPDNSAGYP